MAEKTSTRKPAIAGLVVDGLRYFATHPGEVIIELNRKFLSSTRPRVNVDKVCDWAEQTIWDIATQIGDQAKFACQNPDHPINPFSVQKSCCRCECLTDENDNLTFLLHTPDWKDPCAICGANYSGSRIIFRPCGHFICGLCFIGALKQGSIVLLSDSEKVINSATNFGCPFDSKTVTRVFRAESVSVDIRLLSGIVVPSNVLT
jgi:hypothetical protein